MAVQDNETQLIRSAESMPVPDSVPPSLAEVTDRVSRRRKRRTFARAVALGSVVTACVVLAISVTRDDGAREVAEQRHLAEQRHVVANVPKQPEPKRSPATMVGDDQGPSRVEVVSPLRLFARVRGDSPVFQFNGETKKLQHVGWLRSQQMVPIDMRYVPSGQQDEFQAVLYREPTPLSL